MKKRVGKYIIQISQKLGQGSFSIVTKGYEQNSKQPVAVKIIQKQKIQEDQYTKNALYQEISIMKKLNSKNIIRFYDIIESKTNYYIFMEYAEGGTLRKIMKSKKVFTEKQALSIMEQILNGFRQIVKFGVIHRDFKPENILIKEKIPKIADFGFARQSDNNSFMRTILGSPLYMSPQILKQDKYTYKCDIWALGILFYQLVVGKPPWDLKTNSMLENIMNTQCIEFPSQLKINPKIQQFIMGCLQFDEDKRLDWEKIYMHPLFADKFKNNFTGEKQDSIKLAFVFSGLRMKIHSQNIDIIKLLEMLPQQINLEMFGAIITAIDKNLILSQIKLIYKCCLQRLNKNQGQSITKNQFKGFLKSISVRMQPPQAIQTQGDSQDSSVIISPNYILFQKLRNRIDEKKINIQQIYEPYLEKLSQKPISVEQFKDLIKKIDDKLTNEQMHIIFSEFDIDKDKKIKYSQFIRTICKIAGVLSVPIHK